MNGWSTIETIFYMDSFLIPVVIFLLFKKLISLKEYFYIFAGMQAFDAVLAGILEKWTQCWIAWFFALFFYWVAKNSRDNDDPRNKRKRLKAAIGKKIPKPTLVQIRPVGAT